MDSDKVLELAKQSKISEHLWLNDADEIEAVNNFAALIEQQMIKDGWRSPEQNKPELYDSLTAAFKRHSKTKEQP